MSTKHRRLKKSFETEMWINNQKLPLNHFVQETVANVIIGFTKALKELEEQPQTIEIKIKKLTKSIDVDAHTYP